MLPPDLLQHLFAAAIASAQPAQCVPPYLPRPEEVKGRLVVLGAGKASAAMAQVVEQHWPGPLSGLVVTRYGYQVPCQRIEVVQAAHPVPDAAGLHAAQRMLALAEGLTADDVVLALISGGGSALLPLPLPGITLQDKQAINRALLASGASIGEMNTVRRHLSAIKGGRLAAACHPARVITLLLSDVPGDHPAWTAAVVDRAGTLRALQRADNAGPHTIGAAQGKAYTSASARNTTGAMLENVQKNPGAATLVDIPGFLVLGGGVPVKVGNEVIGAVGVGGAPGGHLDEQCATAGIAKVADLLK